MPSTRTARLRAALRETSLGPRVAIALWAVFAFCVWNVVFDRVLVLAGRRYVYEAAVSAARTPPVYLRIEDSMAPARLRGVKLATTAATGVLVAGIAGVALAAAGRGATASESLQKN
jgi:hypothetical protein